MDSDTKGFFIREGGKLLSDGIRLLWARPRTSVAALQECSPVPSPSSAQLNAPTVSITVPAPSQAVRISLPTSAETTHELKRRLGRELYRAELDLAGGLKIAGKPCDCLSNKHTLGLEAAAEELVSQDPDNAVYLDVIQWIKNNQAKVTPEAIESGKYTQEYPRMALEFKTFRKRVMGTDATASASPAPAKMTLEEAKQIAARQAEAEVERRWNLVEKK